MGASAKKYVCPPIGASRGGGHNLNPKFKTFGFLYTLKVNIKSNYLTSNTLSLLQTKLEEKKQLINFFMFSTLQFQIMGGVGALPPSPLYTPLRIKSRFLHRKFGHSDLTLPFYFREEKNIEILFISRCNVQSMKCPFNLIMIVKCSFTATSHFWIDIFMKSLHL